MARFNAQRLAARILWSAPTGNDDDDADSYHDNENVVQDKSWASVFRARHCDVDFTVIAGSRDNFLSGETDPEGKRPSQLGLKKKYRFAPNFYLSLESNSKKSKKIKKAVALKHFYRFLARFFRWGRTTSTSERWTEPRPTPRKLKSCSTFRRLAPFFRPTLLEPRRGWLVKQRDSATSGTRRSSFERQDRHPR